MPADGTLVVGTQVNVANLRAGFAEAQAAVKSATKNMADAQLEFGKAAEQGSEQAAAALAGYRAELQSAQATLNSFASTQERVAGSTRTVTSSFYAAQGASALLEGRIPIRAMERFLASSQAVQTALQVAFPIIGAVAIGEVLFDMARKVYEVYQNYVSLDAIAEKFYDDVRKMQDQDFINVHSIETANERLKEATENASKLRDVAESLHSAGIGAIMSGNLGLGVSELVAGGTAAKEGVKNQEQSIALDAKHLELQHRINLQKIETAHAGDGALEGAQRINAELQKKLALDKEDAQYVRDQDRLKGNRTPADAGSQMQALKDAQARGEAMAQEVVLARQQAQQAEREAQEAWRQVVGGDKTGKIDTLKQQQEAAKKLAESLKEDVRMMDEMQNAAQKMAEANTKAFREQEQAAAQAAHQQQLDQIQAQISAVQNNPANQSLRGGLNMNALEQLRQMHQSMLQEEERFVQQMMQIDQGLPQEQERLTAQLNQIRRRADEQWAQDTMRIDEQIKQRYTQLFQSIEADSTQLVNSLLRGNQTVGQDFIKLYNMLIEQLADFVVKYLENKAKMYLEDRMMEAANSTAQKAQQQALTAATNVAEVTSYAAVAAAGETAATLDPAAGAAMFAATMAYAPMASFDKGTSFIPRDGMAMLHKGESVLPPPQTSELRSALGRGGRGGNPAFHLNTVNNFNGADHSTFRSMLRSNDDQIVGIVKSAWRDGRLAG